MVHPAFATGEFRRRSRWGQLQACIRPLVGNPWFPGPDGFRTRPASSFCRSRRPCRLSGSWRVGPTCLAITFTSLRATVGDGIAWEAAQSTPPGQRWPEARFRSSSTSTPLAAPCHPKGRSDAREPHGGLTRCRQRRSRRFALPPSCRSPQVIGVERRVVCQHRPRGTRVLVRQRHRGDILAAAFLDSHRPAAAPVFMTTRRA